MNERINTKYTARKTIFSFSKCSEKMVFHRTGIWHESHWDMILLVPSGKMIFFFPENMILFYRRKMKDDLSQENTRKYDVFCIFGKDGASFSYKHEINLSKTYQKIKDCLLPKKKHLKMTFPVSLIKMMLILEKMILVF